MSNDPIRTALERLVELDDGCTADHWHAAITAARAALAAAPEGEPSDEELLESAAKALGYKSIPSDETCLTAEAGEILAFARAVLARWGRPAAPPAPLEGEVGELVAWLHAKGREGLECGLKFAQENGRQLTRAATLLEQLAAAAPAVVPVAVSERPILKSNPFNDAEGRCWCGTAAFADKTGDLTVEHPPSWELRMPQFEDDCVLPAHAIPLPAPQGGEVEK